MGRKDVKRMDCRDSNESGKRILRNMSYFSRLKSA